MCDGLAHGHKHAHQGTNSNNQNYQNNNYYQTNKRYNQSVCMCPLYCAQVTKSAIWTIWPSRAGVLRPNFSTACPPGAPWGGPWILSAAAEGPEQGARWTYVRRWRRLKMSTMRLQRLRWSRKPRLSCRSLQQRGRLGALKMPTRMRRMRKPMAGRLALHLLGVWHPLVLN